VTRTQEIRAEIARLYQGGPVLAVDPDAETPGGALWSPTPPRAWSWGGNGTGAALAQPSAVEDFLALHRPGLVIIEAPLPTGGAWAANMAPQNIVRGGWLWLCAVAYIPSILLPPGVWQPAICGPVRGEGAYKKAYKAHARGLLEGKAVNEDAAAALCMLEFALGALGHELPTEIIRGAPCA
jgi:hypothetical protein